MEWICRPPFLACRSVFCFFSPVSSFAQSDFAFKVRGFGGNAFVDFINPASTSPQSWSETVDSSVPPLTNISYLSGSTTGSGITFSTRSELDGNSGFFSAEKPVQSFVTAYVRGRRSVQVTLSGTSQGPVEKWSFSFIF